MASVNKIFGKRKKRSSAYVSSMFYSHEILRKRGKFGIIWLAACNQHVNRRDIFRVNVANTCEDIIDTIMRRPAANRRSFPLSLYLASQLMFGVTWVSARQHEILLEDIKIFTARLAVFKQGTEIDLDKPLDESKVTLATNMDNVPFGFGNIKSPIIQDPISHYWGDYFVVSTPKSSEAALSLLSAEHDRDVDMLDEGAELLHQAHPADITMQELPEVSEEPFPEEMPGEPVDFFSDFPPEALLEQIPSQPLPEAQQQAATIPLPDHLSFLLSPEDAPVLEDTLQSGQGAGPSSADTTLHARSPAVQQRSIRDDSESFQLAPVPVSGRRHPRRRRLVIDPVITLSSEQLRTNMARVDTQTVDLNLRRASLRESAESMFGRLSRQLVPSGIRNRLRRLQTLQQATDSFPYVLGPPDEPSSLGDAEMPREEEEHVSSAAPISDTLQSVEIQRDATSSTPDPSAAALLRTSSLIKGLSSSASLLARDVSEASLQPPMMEEEFMQPIPEPAIEDLEEMHETTMLPTSDSMHVPLVCDMSPVSPERTPPPSSPESLTPALEETHMLILKTVEESNVPDLTSFNAILRNISPTKRRVAELFNYIIILHAQGLIDIQQPVTDGDIFIKLLLQNPAEP